MHFFEPREYQPVAGRVYSEISSRLEKVLPNATVEHIGSSAVADAISKGDLDIYVEVNGGEFSDAIVAIESLGFHIKPNTLRTNQLCPFESQGYPLPVGIQLVERGSRFEFFRTFRDLLNREAGVRDNYNRMKRSSEHLDEHQYRERKSKFIEAALEEHCG
jgi:GrpB-like predicted nucleotidyltransferase (UPF0157 family)